MACGTLSVLQCDKIDRRTEHLRRLHFTKVDLNLTYTHPTNMQLTWFMVRNLSDQDIRLATSPEGNSSATTAWTRSWIAGELLMDLPRT